MLKFLNNPIYFSGLIYLFILGCQQAPSKVIKQTPISKDSSNNKLDISKDITSNMLPKKTIDYDSSKWFEFTIADNIKLDIAYATAQNFMEQTLYDCDRCFLRTKVADQLLLVRDKLVQDNKYGLVLFDCYRPLGVQEQMWQKFPNPIYVTDPKKGSMHNRGAAVDVGLYDLSNNENMDMGTDFDHFGRASAPGFQDLPLEVKKRRAYLKSTMEQFGFKAINSEWWHYSLSGTASEISNWQWPCPQ